MRTNHNPKAGLLAFSLAALSLGACAGSPMPPAPVAVGEAFVLERDLAGAKLAKGRIQALGGVDRGLEADLYGVYDAERGVLTLKEDFRYDNGETDQKTWVLTKQPNGTWSGTREDVIGTALGYQDGPFFRLEYMVELGDRVVGFRDILYNSPTGVVINKAAIGYRGFRVGGVELTMEDAR